MTVSLWISDKFKTPLANFDFLQKMLNRVIHSGYKHGGERPGGVRNWIPRLEQAIEDYKATGCAERLIDASNFAMYEYTMPDHPAANYQSIDSRGFRKTQGF